MRSDQAPGTGCRGSPVGVVGGGRRGGRRRAGATERDVPGPRPGVAARAQLLAAAVEDAGAQAQRPARALAGEAAREAGAVADERVHVADGEALAAPERSVRAHARRRREVDEQLARAAAALRGDRPARGDLAGVLARADHHRRLEPVDDLVAARAEVEPARARLRGGAGRRGGEPGLERSRGLGGAGTLAAGGAPHAGDPQRPARGVAGHRAAQRPLEREPPARDALDRRRGGAERACRRTPRPCARWPRRPPCRSAASCRSGRRSGSRAAARRCRRSARSVFGRAAVCSRPPPKWASAPTRRSRAPMRAVPPASPAARTRPPVSRNTRVLRSGGLQRLLLEVEADEVVVLALAHGDGPAVSSRLHTTGQRLQRGRLLQQRLRVLTRFIPMPRPS